MTNNIQASTGLDAAELTEIKKKSVLGAASYFGRTLILQGIGFVSILVLSKYFSPENFGIYGIVVQIVGLLVFFSDIGLAAALIQKKDHPSQKDLATAFTIQQLLSWLIVLAVVVIGFAPSVRTKLGVDGVWVMYALGLSFPLAALKTIPSILLERKLEFSKLVVPQIFEQLVFHGVLIILAWSGLGVLAYAYAILGRSIIGVIVIQFISFWKPRFGIYRQSLLELIGFGAKFQLNDLLARIKDQLFYLALGFFLPTREFGYIQWAKNWSLYPYNLTVMNVMAVTFPSFSRLQENKAALTKAIEKSIFFITLVIFPILVGMSVFITPLISVIPDYSKWLPAVPSLIFFSLSIAWSAISTPLTNTLNAIGQINKTLKLMIMWTALTWLMTPALIYLYGFDGVALAALVISFSSYLAVYYVKKAVPFRFLDQVWRQFLAASVMAGVGVVGMDLWSSSRQTLVAGMALASLAYFAAIMIFGKRKLFNELEKLKAAVAAT